jgi:hypothetical protein
MRMGYINPVPLDSPLSSLLSFRYPIFRAWFLLPGWFLLSSSRQSAKLSRMIKSTDFYGSSSLNEPESEKSKRNFLLSWPPNLFSRIAPDWKDRGQHFTAKYFV